LAPDIFVSIIPTSTNMQMQMTMMVTNLLVVLGLFVFHDWLPPLPAA